AVKAATSEDRERERVAEHSRSYWRADWDVAKVGGTYYPLRDGVMRGTSLVVLLVGGWWALFGPPFGFAAPLSVGTFVAFYLYARNFVGHSARLGGLVDTYTDAKASAKRVYGLIHYPATVTEDPDATPLPSVDGRVEFRDVTFRYPDAEEPALREVSFAADAGEFVGLVGPTGAGKTTALKLLLRFYDPDEGIVAVDGHDITAVTLDSLRGAIGYVSQEPFLFDGTVRENIAYGDPGAEEADVVAASKRANAHEFVTDLPDGYDTRVGERGVKLSGGQRQRVAIARVVLEDPAILVLDEATSHVDNETELLIQESLAALVADRTTFAVAHRLSTVRDADHLVVIDDGEVVEQGTHEELLDADGLYATLWDVHVGNVAGLPEGLAGDAR
ncbi:MAG: ABC transporter ATP-binding protein, partial [Halobacteriaceae archaeon]